MKAKVYKIECLTNMHVGSGEVNYNIIDNEVEKDVVFSEATIHSSGVKGALREHFQQKWKDKKTIEEVFGSEHDEKNDDIDKGKKQSKPGKYKFFSASLISRPLRVSDGNVSYVNVTMVELLVNFIDLLLGLGIKKIYDKSLEEARSNLKGITIETFLTNNKDVKSLEGEKCSYLLDNNVKEFLDKLIGGNYAISNSLKDYDLPVLARNCLKEDGTSDNLWYEEIVPHKSIFYFPILIPDDNENLIKFHNEVVQFGGNSSIGYGFSKVLEVGVCYE